MMMGFGMFGWLFGLLFTLVFLGFLVMGVVWLFRQFFPQGYTGTRTSASVVGGGTDTTCPTCGRPVGANWLVCPYDGTPLQGN